MSLMLSIHMPIIGYPNHVELKAIKGMLCPSNPNDDVKHEKAPTGKAPQSRTAPNRFPPLGVPGTIHPEVP